MRQAIHLETISDLYALFGLGHSLHMSVAVVDLGAVKGHPDQHVKISSEFYSIMFKSHCGNGFKYGRRTIDFQDGNLICLAPNQIIEMDEEIEPRGEKAGWGLFFHPDFIRPFPLGNTIRNHGFFSYEISESLHLSEKEKNILNDCVGKIESELKENIDPHSQAIIVSYIELILTYCSRFFGRQFITRSLHHRGIVSRIEEVIRSHFSNPLHGDEGLLTVKQLAESVKLSPSYLSDLLKRETGRNAQEYIHYLLIEEAKNRLVTSDTTVNEIAYSLGFEYPQYFNKLFKQKTGKTPMEFRNLN
jgi:AraC-like DNA-binding protein